jgi:hypothetical protein
MLGRLCRKHGEVRTCAEVETLEGLYENEDVDGGAAKHLAFARLPDHHRPQLQAQI